MLTRTSSTYEGSKDFSFQSQIILSSLFMLLFLVFHPCLAAHEHTLSLLCLTFPGLLTGNSVRKWISWDLLGIF